MRNADPVGRPVVPDHEVLRRIGVGGHGEVWLARAVTGAWRAVKVIHRDRFEDERTFRRELEAVRRFEGLSREHVGFADILQTGWDPKSDYYYYVMELADGVREPWTAEDYEPLTLARMVRERGRLPVGSCLELGMALASGLMVLHGRSLIHRDLKPSNVVYVGGVPKLVDIGLVIGTQEAQSYVGTEGFIAPEGPNSPQADLYGLGKLLYIAVTGKDRRDFPDPGVEMESGAEAAVLREFNLILLKACAADPARRYSTAEQCLADLQRIAGGRSVRWQRRREEWWRVGLRAGMVACGVGGLAWMWMRWNPAADRARWAAMTNRMGEVQASQGQLLRRGVIQDQLGKGQALLEEGDAGGALVHFAEVLRNLTPGTAEERMHRIRIQQAQALIPPLMNAWKTGESIASMAMSPDGHHLAIVDEAGGVSVWDVIQGTQVFHRPRLGGAGLELGYSPDGRRLLVTPPEIAMRNTGEQVERRGMALDSRTGEGIGPEVSGATAMAFRPDGLRVAVATAGGKIEIREVDSGRVLSTFEGHTSTVTRLLFGSEPDGLVSGDADGTVRFWRIPDGREVGRVRHPGIWVQTLRFHPDGRRVWMVFEDSLNQSTVEMAELGGSTTTGEVGKWGRLTLQGRLMVLDPRLMRGRWTLMGQDERVVGNVPGGLTIRDGAEPATVIRSWTMPGRIRSWALSPDGLWLAVGADGGGARVWDVETGEPVSPILGHAGGVHSVVFSADGSRLMTGGADGLVKVWDLTQRGAGEKRGRLSGRVIHEWRSFKPYPGVVDADGRLILGVRRNRQQVAVRVDLDTGREVSLGEFPEDLSCRAVVSGRTEAVWALYDPEASPPAVLPHVGLWRREGEGWSVKRLPHPIRVVAAEFAASDARLVTLDAANRVWNWDTRTGALISQTNLPGSGEMPVLSRDGRRIGRIEEGNRVVRVHGWDAEAGAAGEMRLDGPADALGLSWDARRVALAMRDGRLLVFEVGSGQGVRQPNGWLPAPLLAEWSSQGQRLLVRPATGDAHLVDYAADTIRAIAGTAAGFPAVRVGFGQDEEFLVVHNDADLAWVADAASGLPVTPKWHHAGQVRFAAVTKKGHWATLSDPGLVRVGRLEPTWAPVGVLADRARILSGREVDGAGTLRWMGAGALIEALDAADLGTWAPQEADRKRVVRWQGEHLENLDSLLRVDAARFHHGRLARDSSPEARAIQARAGEIESTAIPARAPGVPASLVDLTPFYTHSLGGMPDGEFHRMPVGVSRLGTMDFDLRGLVRLEPVAHFQQMKRGGFWSSASLPAAACLGIPVHQACRRIHFVMGVDGVRERMAEEVARWRIRYERGTVREFPVVYGRHVMDWAAEPKPGDPAVVPRLAWIGRKHSPEGNEGVFLYHVTWENPDPGMNVGELDFLLGAGHSRPFVVAITVESGGGP